MAYRTEASKKVTEVCRRLRKVYGPVEPPEQGPVLDELIAAILSQNTSDANSGAAFEELQRRFTDWDAVRRASPATIAKTIRRAGLSRQKAPRIKAILQKIHQQRGELSLDFLLDSPTPEAVDYLSQFPGVGPKDGGLRVAVRVPEARPAGRHPRASRQPPTRAHRPANGCRQGPRRVGLLVAPRQVLEFHVELIRHGRTLCLAQNPKCGDCPLLDLCPEGIGLLRTADPWVRPDQE